MAVNEVQSGCWAETRQIFDVEQVQKKNLPKNKNWENTTLNGSQLIHKD